MTRSYSGSLNKQTLSSQVAERMEREIINRGSAGDRLPSEASLCEGYGVSRTIIREAMKTLHARGLVDSKPGSGAHITKPEAQDVSALMERIIRMDSIDYRSTFELRSILESAAVELASQRADEEQLREMDEILERLKGQDLSPDQRLALDFQFHLLIANATGNQLLATLVEAMSNIIKYSMRSGVFVHGGIEDSILRHQKIMDALYAHDPALARDAMREHLDQSYINVRHHQSEPDAASRMEDI